MLLLRRMRRSSGTRLRMMMAADADSACCVLPLTLTLFEELLGAGDPPTADAASCLGAFDSSSEELNLLYSLFANKTNQATNSQTKSARARSDKEPHHQPASGQRRSIKDASKKDASQILHTKIRRSFMLRVPVLYQVVTQPCAHASW